MHLANHQTTHKGDRLQNRYLPLSSFTVIYSADRRILARLLTLSRIMTQYPICCSSGHYSPLPLESSTASNILYLRSTGGRASESASVNVGKYKVYEGSFIQALQGFTLKQATLISVKKTTFMHLFWFLLWRCSEVNNGKPKIKHDKGNCKENKSITGRTSLKHILCNVCHTNIPSVTLQLWGKPKAWFIGWCSMFVTIQFILLLCCQ